MLKMNREKQTQDSVKMNGKPVNQLETQLEEQKKLANEYLDSLKRLKADFENFQKRAVREQINFIKYASEPLINELLDLLDNFERACKNTNDEGIKLIHKQLQTILEKNGVIELQVDEKFDPNLHEAVMAEKSEKKEGTILEVFSKGYKLHDKVIRPSKVKVSGGNEK